MHLLCVRAISEVHTHTPSHTRIYQLSPCHRFYIPSPWTLEIVFPCFPFPHLPHKQQPPSPLLRVSPHSNYLADEGGNLLSLVAAQVPIRENVLYLPNELIKLNELKTL